MKFILLLIALIFTSSANAQSYIMENATGVGIGTTNPTQPLTVSNIIGPPTTIDGLGNITASTSINCTNNSTPCTLEIIGPKSNSLGSELIFGNATDGGVATSLSGDVISYVCMK